MNTIHNVEFNKMSNSQKVIIFNREVCQPDAKIRSPSVALGGHAAIFVFVGMTALVCINSDEWYSYFAVDAEKAEEYLDNTIASYKNSVDERGCQWSESCLSAAYLTAAKKLKDEVYPRPIRQMPVRF